MTSLLNAVFLHRKQIKTNRVPDVTSSAAPSGAMLNFQGKNIMTSVKLCK